MRLPSLSELQTSRDVIDAFGGYNHNLRIGDGEFYDTNNLTSAYYPILSPRKQRGTFTTTSTTPVGLIEKDALCYVKVVGSNLHFVMNGYGDYDLGMTSIGADVERTLTSMGAYVIIMPDKMYINTKDTNDFGKIETEFESAEGSVVTFSLCKADGTSYDINISSPEEPTKTSDNEELPDGYLWLDTRNTPTSLKMYSKSSGVWTSVTSTFVKINCANIGAAFNQWDGVTIEGITIPSLSDLNNTSVIYAKDTNYIVVVGVLDNAEGYSQADTIKVTRWMPEMDFVIESNNRLWGCHYGLNREGKVVNELYASKLGDFKNWNCFLGISTDSYYVSLGTDGQFTGAISYLGYPLFFKENCLHMVYGSYPAEYRVQDTACRGVQKGSSKSLAMVNEVLYYKSRTGICAYSGALPTEISAVLGEKAYSDAVACAHKGKYYISMKDASTNEYALFVCDTEKGIWHKENNLRVKSFCPMDEEIYYTDDTTVGIRSMFGTGTVDSSPISWMAETGVMGFYSPDKKYLSRLSVRLAMDIGSRVVISIQYDSAGQWNRVCSLTGHTLRTFTLPIRPRRCDHFRMRIEGEGEAKIYSITKTTEQGSDV
jgi:hypothetical protein